jgi:hypothetical protein
MLSERCSISKSLFGVRRPVAAFIVNCRQRKAERRQVAALQSHCLNLNRINFLRLKSVRSVSQIESFDNDATKLETANFHAFGRLLMGSVNGMVIAKESVKFKGHSLAAIGSGDEGPVNHDRNLSVIATQYRTEAIDIYW